jgi:glucan phosphoethanolaminetransferase (alkaline phosphatase superfamily)
MEVTHYDKKGNKIGRSSDSEFGGVVAIAFVAGILYAIYSFFNWATEKATNWMLLDGPYNYIAAFYNYIILTPIKTGGDIAKWLDHQAFTQYPNVNFIIVIVGVLAYIILIISIIRLFIKLLEKFGNGILLLFLFLMTPAILSLVWFTALELVNWLTSTT